MTARFVEMWKAEEVPSETDALFRSDGRIFAIDGVDGAGLPSFEVGSPLTEDEAYGDVTQIGRFDEVPVSGGVLVCGEGAYGSEGYFARLDAGGVPVWVVSLLDSNPFERIIVEGHTATFVNNLGNWVAVDLDSEPFRG